VSTTPADAVRRLRERLLHRSAAERSAEASARELLPELAGALRNAGARRVVLFGSLAAGRFREGSDIDLAVSGLPERVLASFEHDFTVRAGRPVELSNLDRMPSALRENVERFGRDIT
jgi:predicted nucleotidyltransferase